MSAQHAARIDLAKAMDLAEHASPAPADAAKALRELRLWIVCLMSALTRVRDAAGLPRDMCLLDVDQGVAELRRQAEGKS